MKRLSFVLVLIMNSLFVHCQEMTAQDHKVVTNFIKVVKSNQVNKLAEKVSYPLTRRQPIPAIKNKADFIKRYREVFDDSLIRAIVKSDPNTDWARVGWRGIMLQNGDLWLDDDGKLIAVNYQSKAEVARQAQLIAQVKSQLYPTLKTFVRPVYTLETAKYRIRIDEIGEGNYRYAAWPVKRKISDKPDLVIENGQYIPDGTGGNCTYKFENDGYTYNCDIIVLGERSSPPAMLTVIKGDKELLSQRAVIK